MGAIEAVEAVKRVMKLVSNDFNPIKFKCILIFLREEPDFINNTARASGWNGIVYGLIRGALRVCLRFDGAWL